jgi:hypothetical protein
MAANKLKRYAGSAAIGKLPGIQKSLDQFTGEGEEHITGKGGGALLFQNGKLYSSSPATFQMAAWTHEETATSLAQYGKFGLPIEVYRQWSFNDSIPSEISEILSIPDIADLAAQVIQAIYSGKPEVLRRLAKIAASPNLPALTLNHKVWASAVHDAAQKRQGVPTMEDVIDCAKDSIDPATGGKVFSSRPRLDHAKTALNKIGFGWLAHNKRGDHLRKAKAP